MSGRLEWHIAATAAKWIKVCGPRTLYDGRTETILTDDDELLHGPHT